MQDQSMSPIHQQYQKEALCGLKHHIVSLLDPPSAHQTMYLHVFISYSCEMLRTGRCQTSVSSIFSAFLRFPTLILDHVGGYTVWQCSGPHACSYRESIINTGIGQHLSHGNSDFFAVIESSKEGHRTYLIYFSSMDHLSKTRV